MKVTQKTIKSGLVQSENYWDDKAVNAKTDCEKVDQNVRTQFMRYSSFVLFHNLENTKILDVGCGVGDFWKHLKSKGIDCYYVGFDLSSEMIRQCQQRIPEVDFISGNICEWQPEEPFDYVVSFGIHNIKIDGAFDILKQVTERQFELCKKAAHISILTDRYTGFGSHAQAWNPEIILNMALDITPYVVLRHDYLPNDFSVTLYREPLIDTIKDLLSET